MSLQNDYRVLKNNTVEIAGKISSNYTLSHEIFGEAFYMMDVTVERQSGVEDIIPVMVSERLVNPLENCKDRLVRVYGQFRSYNNNDENGKRLVLSIFAKAIEFVDKLDGAENTNKIYLDGYVCKAPIYRRTPLGRDIADVLVAVNRPYGKTDYLPCICWGRNAKFAERIKVGTHVILAGRIQSRNYIKKFPDGTSEMRVAWEVSACTIEVVE